MDYLTVCLEHDEAAVRSILESAPFKHTHVETFQSFVNGDFIFQVYQGGVPTAVAGLVSNGDKVVIHTAKKLAGFRLSFSFLHTITLKGFVPKHSVLTLVTGVLRGQRWHHCEVG
jgi:hypothetical protein